VEQSSSIQILESDLSWEFTRGRGKGGQNRNKRDTAVRLTHKPTGIQIWCEDERNQRRNKETALRKLIGKLEAQRSSSQSSKQNRVRRGQIGSGMRGDKIRTIRVRDNRVTNHVNGKKMSFKKYCAGNFSELLGGSGFKSIE